MKAADACRRKLNERRYKSLFEVGQARRYGSERGRQTRVPRKVAKASRLVIRKIVAGRHRGE